jgi:hypothetical protein
MNNLVAMKSTSNILKGGYLTVYTMVILLFAGFSTMAEHVSKERNGHKCEIAPLPVYWAEADLVGIEGCCAEIQVRLYLLDDGQTWLIHSGTYYASLGDKDCCPTTGIDQNDPKTTAGFSEAYNTNNEIKNAVDAAIAEVIGMMGKTSFEETYNPNLELYPNPASTVLTLKIANVESPWVGYKIFNANGDLILVEGKKPAINSQLEVDIKNGFKSGTYFLVVNINGKKDVIKFTVLQG